MLLRWTSPAQPAAAQSGGSAPSKIPRSLIIRKLSFILTASPTSSGSSPAGLRTKWPDLGFGSSGFHKSPAPLSIPFRRRQKPYPFGHLEPLPLQQKRAYSQLARQACPA